MWHCLCGKQHEDTVNVCECERPRAESFVLEGSALYRSAGTCRAPLGNTWLFRDRGNAEEYARRDGREVVEVKVTATYRLLLISPATLQVVYELFSSDQRLLRALREWFGVDEQRNVAQGLDAPATAPAFATEAALRLVQAGYHGFELTEGFRRHAGVYGPRIPMHAEVVLFHEAVQVMPNLDQSTGCLAVPAPLSHSEERARHRPPPPAQDSSSPAQQQVPPEEVAPEEVVILLGVALIVVFFLWRLRRYWNFF